MIKSLRLQLLNRIKRTRCYCISYNPFETRSFGITQYNYSLFNSRFILKMVCIIITSMCTISQSSRCGHCLLSARSGSHSWSCTQLFHCQLSDSEMLSLASQFLRQFLVLQLRSFLNSDLSVGSKCCLHFFSVFSLIF